ncbi:MAG: sulfatase family protein, partial [Pirellulaceae bacterium]
DAMAAAGLRFDRFYAAAPVCSPTRASVLTGRTNRRTGVESHGFALRRQEQSIATLLRSAGSATGHFGKWHLNGLRGPGAPVLVDDTHHPGVFGFDTWLSVTNFFDMNPIMSRNGVFEEFAGDSSEIIVDQAIEFMRQQADADKPFFTVIWYGTPHSPFMADETDIRPFADVSDERSRKQLAELVAMDRSIGTLRAALRQMQIADNTIVWFTSDNGGLPNLEPETVGGLRGNKRSLYEGGIRVPGIVEWPAQIEPRVTSYPAVSMDIVATIADLVGIPPSQLVWPQDGISLRPLFRSELATRDKPIPFSCFEDMAVVDNNFKLLRLGGSEQILYELYDLDNDPAEQINLYDMRPEIATRMQELLNQHDQSIQQSIAGADYEEGSVNPGEPPPRSWIDDPRYRPYFDEWRDRPEYRSWLRDK